VLEDALNGATKDNQNGGGDDAQKSKNQAILNHRLAALFAQVKKAHPGICDNGVDELQSLFLLVFIFCRSSLIVVLAASSPILARPQSPVSKTADSRDL
jgi:hypothetical protein